MDELELLGTIQDALKLALESELSAGIPADLGFPAALLEEHMWIDGSADGDPDYDLSNGVKSGVVISVTISAIEQFAADYDDARTALKVMWDAATDAVAALATAGTVDHVEFAKWQVREGRTAEGRRQLAFSRDVEFTKWLG
jgi:Cdc6-like AAA superfamily ATPase